MSGPTIVPYLSYRDAKAAIAFLSEAFGLGVVQAYDDDTGTLQHAEMHWRGGVIMLGTVAEDVPKASPGLYLVVEDVDAHFERASAAGATIVYPPEETDWGTRRYRAQDPEGHEWSFGTYAPTDQAPSWA